MLYQKVIPLKIPSPETSGATSINPDVKTRPIHIGIDLTALLPQPTGVDNYLLGLVTYLSRIDESNQYTIFVNHEDLHLFRSWTATNFTIVPFSSRPRPVRLVFQQLGLPMAARFSKIQVLHSPSFLMPQ
jgi:hypothetical protein